MKKPLPKQGHVTAASAISIQELLTGLGGVDCSSRMLWRGIEHIHLEFCFPCIGDVVPIALWDKHGPVISNSFVVTQVCLARAHLHPSLALFHPDELVTLLVNL